MTKILNFGKGVAVAALTVGLGTANAYAYTPPSLGSPQQNMGLEPAGSGLSVTHNVSTTSVMSVLVKSSTGTVFDVEGFVPSTSPVWLHLYAGVTAAPTCSLTTVSALVELPASATTRVILNDQYGVGFAGGVGFCATGLAANGDTTALLAGDDVDVYYK
jgi:hypothetical protein